MDIMAWINFVVVIITAIGLNYGIDMGIVIISAVLRLTTER